jgi:hypothetical protein
MRRSEINIYLGPSSSVSSVPRRTCTSASPVRAADLTSNFYPTFPLRARMDGTEAQQTGRRPGGIKKEYEKDMKTPPTGGEFLHDQTNAKICSPPPLPVDDCSPI